MALLALYLHGSAATGDSVDGSDVDVLRIVEHPDERDDGRAQALEHLGDRWADDALDLSVLALEDLSALHFPLIAHGTQLYGDTFTPVAPSPDAWAHDAYRFSAQCLDNGAPIAAALWSAAGRAVDTGATIPPGKAAVPGAYRTHVGDRWADTIDELHARRRDPTPQLERAALDFLDDGSTDELLCRGAVRINAVSERTRAENLERDPQSVRYVVARGALTADQCALAIGLAKAQGLEPRLTLKGVTPPANLRSAHLDHPDALALEDRFSTIIADANDTHWRCDLSFNTGIRVHRYRTGAELPWHLDLYPGGSSAKLFAAALLSDDFDGGALSILDGPEPITLDLREGDVVVAPTWLLHMVDTVTRGTRWSATFTSHGRPWR